MTGFPIYVLLTCGSLMLLGVSAASAAAQYLRSQESQAVAGATKRSSNR